MNDNELSRHERALIDAALTGETPPPEARDRVRSAVLARVAAVAAGTTIATTTATQAAAGVSSIVFKALVVVGLAGAGTGAYIATRSTEPPAPPPHTAPIEPAQPSPPPPPSAVRAEASVAVAPSAAASTVMPPSTAVAPPPGRPTVAEEVALLKEAQRQMQSGNPDKALALLDEHEKKHKTGALREERTAARVLALCKAGKREEARALAARFLAESPSSPLAGRVRSACQ